MKHLLPILLLAVAACLMGSHAQAQVIVIANNSVKSSDVSKSEIKDVFNGDASAFKDGSKATPILLKGGAANDQFLNEYVGKSDSAFKASWRGLVFSGQGAMPKTVDSEAAMVDYVAHNSGAVGYISKSTAHEGVKVLEVK
jgi:hypothetical protein